MCSQIVVRLNGGMHKSHQEIYLDFREEDRPPLRAIIKEFCKRFGCKEKVRSSVLYNKSGLQLFDKDIDFIKADDVLYIALDGKQNEIDWEGGRGAGGRTFRRHLDVILLCLCIC